MVLKMLKKLYLVKMLYLALNPEARSLVSYYMERTSHICVIYNYSLWKASMFVEIATLFDQKSM